MAMIKILGIGGSLRKGSYSKAVLEAAMELLPKNVSMEMADISQIPIFNQDEEAESPPSVKRLKKQIRDADAILFCTPEYNFGIPGYLKNAIDWASRPYGDNSFDDKPAAVMSASDGMLGGIKAQLQLRQSFVFLNIHAVNDSVTVSQVTQKLGPEGKLADQRTRERIRELVEELVAWTIRIKE
ncbi:MAG: NAD(P)H-dependent oxidoreductase [Candidatus Micrarchaeales archaeon]|nr:NAD(P)H-dependent oxidoreductase [Candidatus Micrarchaeales archaeon]